MAFHKGRLLTAARLLSGTLISVQEISELVGYESCASFQHAFKRWCGLYPSVFREHSQRVREEARNLPDDVLSWTFLKRYQEGNMTDDEARVLLRFLEKVYGLTS